MTTREVWAGSHDSGVPKEGLSRSAAAAGKRGKGSGGDRGEEPEEAGVSGSSWPRGWACAEEEAGRGEVCRLPCVVTGAPCRGLQGDLVGFLSST